jgi:membrane-associated PAP2 superfamily phosphatase
VRLAALTAVSGFLAVALGIRALAGSGGVLDSSGALAQYSGTALYASMIYSAVFLMAPGTRPMVAGAAATTFCWLVELLQLTGLPAELSEHSLVARLVLGVQFDAIDLAWYAIGVLPLVVLHRVLAHRGLPRVCEIDRSNGSAR